jgi:hypothetical protein
MALERPGCAEPVQRVDDEIGVAQPAIAVVPGALSVRCFGHGGRQRRDDASGVVERIELQRDGRADHLVLPFERDREVAHPVPPVARSLLVQAAPGLERTCLQRFVRAKDEGQRIVDQEAAGFDHMRDRRVGRQPQPVDGHFGAYVMTAEGHRRLRRAVIATRGEANADPRPPGEPPYEARS